jgi:hypothetical protein
VQSAADLLRIRSMEEQLLRDEPLVASDPGLVRALRSHKALIDRFYYYRAFTDAVKQRAGSRAVGLLFGSPSGFRHIALESLLRAPTITMKALRGGYRSGQRSASL